METKELMAQNVQDPAQAGEVLLQPPKRPKKKRSIKKIVLLSLAGIAVLALAGMMLVAFVAGLSLQPRLGILGRSVWVGVLFLGSVTSMVLSRDFLWVVFPLWLLVGSAAGLTASIKLHAPDWLTGDAWLGFGRPITTVGHPTERAGRVRRS